jgi:hypothetical protein
MSTAVGIRFGRWLLAVAVALFCLPAAASAAGIVNGDFESGTLEGWTVVASNEAGTWLPYSGTLVPPPFDSEGREVPPPPQGKYAAITAQGGPGTRILYQDFTVAAGVPQQLSLITYYTSDAALLSPETLDTTGESNQQIRIDVMKPSAPVDSVATGDVLLNLFRTETGGSQVMDPTTLTADLAPFAGQTVRLRIAEADTQSFLNAGIDAVSLTPAPEPLAGLGEVWLGKPVAKNRKTGVSTIAVGLPAAGTLKVQDIRAVTGKGKSRIKPVTLAIPKSETIPVDLRPTAEAMKTLKAKGKVTLRASFTLTLADGRTISLDRRLALRLAKASPNSY